MHLRRSSVRNLSCVNVTVGWFMDAATTPDMDSFRGEDIPRNWYKGVSRLLENMSKGLAETPEAADCVR